MKIVVQNILGFLISDDAKTVEIGVRSGPDTVRFVFPTPDLNGVIDILTQARDAAAAKGLPTDAQIQAKQPKSVAVSKSDEFIGAVVMYFDRAEPTRSAFMIGSQAAIDTGHQLVKAGRKAADAASIVRAAASETRKMMNGKPQRQIVIAR